MEQRKCMVVALLVLVLIVGMLPLPAGAKNVLPENLPRMTVPEVNVGDLKPFSQAVKEDLRILTPNSPAVDEIQADASGTCGDGLTWTKEGNYLFITGEGPMYDYSDANPAPWKDFNIFDVYIEEGVTSIGDQAFADSRRLQRVIIYKDVTSVGSRICDGVNHCTLYFLGDTPDFAPDAFAGTECRAYYFRDWDESVLQNYGGESLWQKGSIVLSPSNKQLYALNEPIKTEELVFYATYASGVYTIAYTPGKVEIGEYDNSTYGQKSVEITVDGTVLTYDYYVSDGENHKDLLTVEYDPIQYYTNFHIWCDPIVKAGDVVLESGVDYTITYDNNIYVGSDASFTITGMGLFEGFEKTYPFAILKNDIANATFSVSDAVFLGIPVAPEVTVMMHDGTSGWTLTAGKDYVILLEDNVNIGTGTVRIIGVGGYHGQITTTFEIVQEDTSIMLGGAYNGSAEDDNLNGDLYYMEGLMCPGVFTGRIDSPKPHVAYYVLYRLEGEDAIEVAEYETEYATAIHTEFTYDFTDVYNSTSKDGGEIYMLAYSWIDSDYYVYSGACVLYISAKVPAATVMNMQLSIDNDFRQEYLVVHGEDGVLGNVSWTSSNDSVLSVSDGVVTLKKPGTATITAASGVASESWEITAPSLNLADGVILCCDTAAESAIIIYDGEILKEGTDYQISVSVADDITEVTAIGCGLFSSHVMRQFDTATGEALGHTHTFDSSCDTTCNRCDFTREGGHQYSTDWIKDMDHHWHECSVCGEKADHGQHIISEEDDTLCTVCGKLYILGDLDQDFTVDEDDAIYLLQHVLLPEFFPVAQAVDYTGDGQVNEDDAIYLLQHVLLPEFFPL